ncbi:MAG: hypothetical protein KatS3mg083_347 [Candidatus Dojkabacteria bacterium]|nr:MAG: hypothetical protein KatS3mg083_347 [Candidatus Dojkabacteria bacterium]
MSLENGDSRNGYHGLDGHRGPENILLIDRKNKGKNKNRTNLNAVLTSLLETKKGQRLVGGCMAAASLILLGLASLIHNPLDRSGAPTANPVYKTTTPVSVCPPWLSSPDGSLSSCCCYCHSTY